MSSQTEFNRLKAQKDRITAKHNKALIRANAIIDCLKIFYPNQVDRAENLVDYAMKTPDNTPVQKEMKNSRSHVK